MGGIPVWSHLTVPPSRSRAVFPTSEQDLISAVLSSRQSPDGLKAAGARGSKNGCFQTSGIPIRLDRYDRILSIHGGTVTAQAGATVGVLNAALQRHGLALFTHGEWAGATLAGAAATGTHGGSLSRGIFSTSLLEARIILANGEARDFRRGDPDFEHVGVSLGALGVLSTLTFDCEALFFLEMEMKVLPFEEYLAAQDGLIKENEFFSAVWSPRSGRVLTFGANRAPVPMRAGRRRERFCFRHCLHHRLSRLQSFDAFPTRWSGLKAVAPSDEILSPISGSGTRARLLRFLGKFVTAVEFAVPLGRAEESLAALHGLLLSHAQGLVHPVGLRATAGDGFSLSPAFGRETFWIDLFFFPSPRFENDLAEVFTDLDARCHWGKHIGLPPDHLHHQYRGWEAFWKLRSEMDPDRVFSNDFIRSLKS